MAKDRAVESEGRWSGFHRDGFVVVEGLIDSDLCEAVISDMRKFVDFDSSCSKPSTIRLTDLWTKSEAIRALATDNAIAEIVVQLLGSESFPFQTLNFLFGSEQAAHSDLIHFSTRPYGGMCGVWVALEEVRDDCGPLFYYPFSHRLRPHVYESYGLSSDAFGSQGTAYRNYEELLQKRMTLLGFEKQQFLGKRGDVLFWHANLVHGGEPRVDPMGSRYSQVTHWFCRNRHYFSPINGWSTRAVNEIPKLLDL